MPPDDVDGRAAPAAAAAQAAAGRTAVAAMIMNDQPCDDAELAASGSDTDVEATARWWDVARDAGVFASASETDVAIIGTNVAASDTNPLNRGANHVFFPKNPTGNGPAGIALSWMLDGNVPYYDDSVGPHPNPVLHGKLGLRRDLSLLDQVRPFPPPRPAPSAATPRRPNPATHRRTRTAVPSLGPGVAERRAGGPLGQPGGAAL